MTQASLTKQIKGAIYLDTSHTSAPLRYAFFEGQAASWANYELVCEHTVEFLAPPAEAEIKVLVDALETKRTKLRADFEATMTQLQSKINNLLALSYDATEEAQR